MADEIVQHVEENEEPASHKQFRRVLSDAFAFIRSVEANTAFASVSLEDLMEQQIARNGETAKSNAAQNNPYSYDPENPAPDGLEPAPRANFLGASDLGRPTKIDTILALKNELSDIIKEIKEKEPVEVADADTYSESAEIGVET